MSSLEAVNDVRYHDQERTYHTYSGGVICVTDHLMDYLDDIGRVVAQRFLNRTLSFDNMSDDLALRYAKAIKDGDWTTFRLIAEEEKRGITHERT